MSAVMSGTYTGDAVGSTKIEETKSKSGLSVLHFGSPQSQQLKKFRHFVFFYVTIYFLLIVWC